MSFQFQAKPAPADPKDLPAWVQQQFDDLTKALQQTTLLWLKTQYKEPAKPREGMIVLADGTEWNPGAAQGFYGYYGSSWHKLG